MPDAAPAFPTDLVSSRPFVPLVAKGVNATIRASAVLTADFVASAVVDCVHARNLALTLKYDAAAAGTANTPTLILMGSNAAAQPLVGDDEWGALAELEISGTDAVQADSLPAGVDLTVTPEFVTKKLRPLAITTHPSDAGTDKLRMLFVVPIDAIRYLFVLAKEEGDTDAGQLGTLAIDAAVSS